MSIEFKLASISTFTLFNARRLDKKPYNQDSKLVLVRELLGANSQGKEVKDEERRKKGKYPPFHQPPSTSSPLLFNARGLNPRLLLVYWHTPYAIDEIPVLLLPPHPSWSWSCCIPIVPLIGIERTRLCTAGRCTPFGQAGVDSRCSGSQVNREARIGGERVGSVVREASIAYPGRIASHFRVS